MFSSSRLIAILLLMPPVASMAQQHRDPADPAASGQPIAYVSVFTTVQAAPEAEQVSPDKSWIAHNRQLMPAGKTAAPALNPAATPPPAHQHGTRGQGS